jgi:hypothetical protein
MDTIKVLVRGHPRNNPPPATQKRDPRIQLTLAARELEKLFFPVVLLCQFLVLVGNRFWFYILTNLEYNTVRCCVSFLVLAGNSCWCYVRT